METKYKMPKPHKHAELIKAWAIGAKILEKSKFDKCKWEYNQYPNWLDVNMEFMIEPTCDYAKAKIAKLGDDAMVELYLYWLDGGEIICHFCKQTHYTPKPNNDPFNEFVNLLNNYDSITKKKRMVKQVLYVLTSAHGVPPDTFNTMWLDVDKPIRHLPNQEWHKVPSCTREVESDD